MGLNYKYSSVPRIFVSFDCIYFKNPIFHLNVHVIWIIYGHVENLAMCVLHEQEKSC